MLHNNSHTALPVDMVDTDKNVVMAVDLSYNRKLKQLPACFKPCPKIINLQLRDTLLFEKIIDQKAKDLLPKKNLTIYLGW